ncbi:MAG: carboxymuconolactone decarboxylase family protein [Novosphingobium sp.]|nr:carboxymuconolactone decarboxylase family protein [Novosphingobium sp.]
MNDEQIAAREAEVLGAPPRVRPLAPEELSPEVAELAREIGNVLGIPEPEDLAIWFKIMAHHPGLYRRHLEVGIELLGRGALPPVERELAIMRTGWLCGAPYEWSEHVAIARKLGVDAATIERVIVGSAAPGWSEHERALIRAVEELLADKMIGDATWEVLARSWNERQLIELPTLVGQYVAVAMMQNSLRLPLSHDRHGLRQR